MKYIPVLEDPWNNLFQLPSALTKLPMNAVLHQSWRTIFSIFTILIILASPTLALMINTAEQIMVGNETKGPVGVAAVIFILIGVSASFFYLKVIYGTLENLVESRKAPWLVEKIKKPFQEIYQKQWNKQILVISFFLPVVMEIPLAVIAYSNATNIAIWMIILWIFALVIGHFGLSLLIYISILSYYYVILNTRIYDQVLQTIRERVKGYTEGHESILSKKNYEVVGVLSDTPGLSVQSLGNIPIYGLGSSIFVINAIIFLLFTPFLLDGPIADFLITNFSGESGFNDPFGLNIVILIGVIISAIASFGAVLRPLIRITSVMANFKNKALSELDPFLFDRITGVALRRDTNISNEDSVLFMIRNYIYSMKVSPVHPFRLIQIVALAILYTSRALPSIIRLIAGV